MRVQTEAEVPGSFIEHLVAGVILPVGQKPIGVCVGIRVGVAVGPGTPQQN